MRGGASSASGCCLAACCQLIGDHPPPDMHMHAPCRALRARPSRGCLGGRLSIPPVAPRDRHRVLTEGAHALAAHPQLVLQGRGKCLAESESRRGLSDDPGGQNWGRRLGIPGRQLQPPGQVGPYGCGRAGEAMAPAAAVPGAMRGWAAPIGWLLPCLLTCRTHAARPRIGAPPWPVSSAGSLHTEPRPAHLGNQPLAGHALGAARPRELHHIWHPWRDAGAEGSAEGLPEPDMQVAQQQAAAGSMRWCSLCGEAEQALSAAGARWTAAVQELVCDRQVSKTWEKDVGCSSMCSREEEAAAAAWAGGPQRQHGRQRCGGTRRWVRHSPHLPCPPRETQYLPLYRVQQRW